MSGFNEREKDLENKHAWEEKMAFKIQARGAKLFGQWVSGKLGMTGDQAQNYVIETINRNLENPGFAAIIKKAFEDLNAKGIAVTEHALQNQMDDIAEEARDQIMNETTA